MLIDTNVHVGNFSISIEAQRKHGLFPEELDI
jgi:hypothetical protein